MKNHAHTCADIFHLIFSFSIFGVRGSLVITFAAIRLQGPRFKPRPGQKFETRFLLHAHPCSKPPGTQYRVLEPVPSVGTHRKKTSDRNRNRNLKLLKRYSKAKRTRVPAYSRALK